MDDEDREEESEPEEEAEQGVKGGEAQGAGREAREGEIVRLFDEGGFRLPPPAPGFSLSPVYDRLAPDLLIPESLPLRRLWAGRIQAIQKYGPEVARRLYPDLWVSEEEWARWVDAAGRITVRRVK